MNHALLARDTDTVDASKLHGRSLRVNQPGDSFEREADRVADTVGAGGFVATKLPEWSLTGAVQRQTPGPGQPVPQEPAPNEYGQALGKLAEAAVKTKPVEKMIANLTEDDPLVSSTVEFVKTPGGIALTGAAATGVIATLAATHRPLPLQVPAIPLDKVSSRLSGYKLQLTWQGPVDRPTNAMVSLSYEPGAGKRKKPDERERFRAETARMALEQQRFREGLQPAAGPQLDQKKTEDSLFRAWFRQRIGAAPGTDVAAEKERPKPAPGLKPTPAARPEEKKTVPQGVAPIKEELPAQRKADPSAAGVLDSSDAPGPMRSGGSALDQQTRRYMERRIGFDFSRVRVHTDTEAASSAKSLGALAYTVGNDVVFARGMYSPATMPGRRLLAHELTHVVQQSPRARAVEGTTSAISRTAPRRAQRLWNPIEWAKEKVLGKLKQLPGYTLFTVVIEKDPITGEHVDRNAANLIHGILDLVPGGQDVYRKLEESKAIERAFDWLKAEVDKLGFSVDYFIDLLRQAKDAVSLSVDESWARIKEIFREPYEKLKSFASAVVHKVLEFVLEAAIEAIGGKEIADQIMDFFRKAGAAIKTIVNDPAGFLGHLLDAVKKGFGQFADNILEHLKNGLIKWIFGEIATTGLVLPKRFDLPGIVNLVLQVLGISWGKVKKKLETVLGEPAVQFLEGAFDIIKAIADGGIGAAWKLILEKAEGLFDTVLTAIREWVVTKIVTLAVTHLASLFNPVGGVIESIRVIYETIKFFIDKAKQIGALIKAIVDSIAEIASGNIAKAANFIETTLAAAVPLVLRFLAGLIGLGNVGDKVREIIKKLQDKVDSAMDKVLNFLVEKGKALWAAGKEGFAYVAEWWKAKRPFKLGDEDHTLSIEGDEDSPQIIVASNSPTTLQIFLDNLSVPKEEKRKLLEMAKKIKLRKKNVKDKGVDSEKIFSDLVERISKLTPGGEMLTKPSKFKEKQKTNKLGGGKGADIFLNLNHPVGSEPRRDQDPLIWTDLGSLIDKKTYIRGHLLSQRLGGQGEWENMMPITNSANQTMFNQVEKKIIETVATGKKAVHYQIFADYANLKPVSTPKEAEQRLDKVRWQWNLATYEGDWKDAKNATTKEPDGGSGSVKADQ